MQAQPLETVLIRERASAPAHLRQRQHRKILRRVDAQAVDRGDIPYLRTTDDRMESKSTLHIEMLDLLPRSILSATMDTAAQGFEKILLGCMLYNKFSDIAYEFA